jgi:hypothetical protein
MEEDAAHRMGKLVESSRKPIVLHSLYNYAKPHSLDLLRYYHIPYTIPWRSPVNAWRPSPSTDPIGGNTIRKAISSSTGEGRPSGKGRKLSTMPLLKAERFAGT